MTVESWTVFFNFKPFTTIYTTVLVEQDLNDDQNLIELAKQKIHDELRINIDEMVEQIGVNTNFGAEWILCEQNDLEPTKEELEVLTIHKE